MAVPTGQEYLVRYGLMGDIGRFRADRPAGYARGDRVVVASERGLELGEVVRPATPGHAEHLRGDQVPALVRPADRDDEVRLSACAARARALLDRAVALARSMHLAIEPIDAEVLLDGKRAILEYLRWDQADIRPLIAALGREFDLTIDASDLTSPPVTFPAGPSSGCGSCSSGGCGSCAGGCSSGGCGGCASKSKAKTNPAPRVTSAPGRVSLL